MNTSHASFRHLLAVLSVVPALGCAGLSEDEARTYSMGLEAQQAGRWQEAIQSLSQVLDANPLYPPAHLHRGVCHFEAGDLEKARDDLDAALRNGSLADSDLHRALFYRARTLMEISRRLPKGTPDSEGSSREDLLAEARLDLERAVGLRRTYDTLFWLGYCHVELQAFDAALLASAECSTLNPDRLGHDLLRAMILDRSSRQRSVPPNARSLFLDTLEKDSDRDLDILYEYLAAEYDRLDPRARDQVFTFLEDYEEKRTDRLGSFDETMSRIRARRERERVIRTMSALRTDVQRLRAESRFEEALEAVASTSRQLPPLEELGELRRNLEEHWSRHLERQAEEILVTGRWPEMRRGLDHLIRARELTSAPARRAVLQQKIDTFRLAVHRLPLSPRLARVQQELWSSRYLEAQKLLVAIEPDRLTPDGRVAHAFLSALTHFHLQEWQAAVEDFEKVASARFMNVDVFLGIALWHVGRSKEALDLLRAVPLRSRPAEALRILGKFHLSRNEFAAAIDNLERIEQPRRDDLDATQRALVGRGTAAAKAGNWEAAVEDFREARKIIESRLNKRGTRVYLSLGKAFWHLGEFDRSEKAIKDLLASELTDREKRQFREAFLYRALLHLNKKDTLRAFQDFETFVGEGGEIPEDFLPAYQRAMGLHADFMPLERVAAWNYRDTYRNRPVTVRLLDTTTPGAYEVSIVDGAAVRKERWIRENGLLHIEGPSGRVTIPVSLREDGEVTSGATGVNPPPSSPPTVSRVVSLGDTVSMDGGEVYNNCLVVQTISRQATADGGETETRTLRTLAPGLGEIKREDFTDGVKTGELVLQSVQMR